MLRTIWWRWHKDVRILMRTAFGAQNSPNLHFPCYFHDSLSFRVLFRVVLAIHPTDLDAAGIPGKLKTSRMWLHRPGNPIHTKFRWFSLKICDFQTFSATFSGSTPRFLSIFKKLRGRNNQNSYLKLPKPFVNLLYRYLCSESQSIFIFYGSLRILYLVARFRVERPIFSLWVV